MARTEKYFLGPGLLSDIRQALLRVDAIAPSTSGVVSDVLLDRLPERGRNPLQRGTFTHAVWAVGSTMQVTIQGGTNTISVTNYCIPVEGETSATQVQNVVFGRVMGTVTAVEIQQPPIDRLQRGTFTNSDWPIGSTMQVTIQGSTNTINVTNYCVPVKGQTNATQTLNVVFGRVMGTVTAIEIQQATATCTTVIGGLDVTELPGFDAAAIQLLGHAEGNTNSTACLGLQWYSVTQCSTATAT